MVSDYVWTFTTNNLAPPTVISTIPTNNAGNIDLNTNISATFAMAMDATTFSTSTFTVKQGTTAIPGVVSYNGSTATFNPDNNENGVILGKVITATFNEAMDEATLNNSTFTLKRGTISVAGSVTTNGAVATFTPATNLVSGVIYTATLTTGVKNAHGTKLATTYTWSFNTVAPLGPTAVNLKTAARFGILAGEQIVNNTGATEVRNMDIGVTPGLRADITDTRRVSETFPVSNFVFFDKESTQIPNRYVLLRKNQVADFKEDQLEVFKPKNLSGRSDRQMVVYYNLLNVLGDRMSKDPSTNIWLSGSSSKGIPDGLAMAESVKKYLVDVFGIDASRITTEGRIDPRVPSEQPGGTKELDLLREEDRRVSIWSDTPALMMQFQSGKNAPMKSV